MITEKPIHRIDFHHDGNEMNLGVANDVFAGRAYPIPPPTVGFSPKVVCDIGAHFGAASMYFHVRWPDARYHCWEPFPETFKYLQKNVAHFATVHDRGISAGGGPLRGVAIAGWSSVTNRLTPLLPDEPPCNVLMTDAASILTGLHPDIIKIDIEGMELEVVKAVPDTFRAAKVVYIEYHNHTDRKVVEEILGPDKIMFFAKTNGVNRSEFAYIDKSIIDPKVLAEDAL